MQAARNGTRTLLNTPQPTSLVGRAMAHPCRLLSERARTGLGVMQGLIGAWGIVTRHSSAPCITIQPMLQSRSPKKWLFWGRNTDGEASAGVSPWGCRDVLAPRHSSPRSAGNCGVNNRKQSAAGREEVCPSSCRTRVCRAHFLEC